MKVKSSRYDKRVHASHKFSTIENHKHNPLLVIVSLWEGGELVTRRQYKDLDKAYAVAKLHAYPEIEELMQ